MSTKVSLYDATNHLARLMDKAESEENINAELMAELDGTSISVSEAIDRRKYVIAECDTKIETAKKMIAQIREHIKKIESMQQRIKRSTLSAMKLAPKAKFKDTLGREVKIAKSQKRLEVLLDQKSLTVSHCIDHSVAYRTEVYPYVTPREYYVLDVDKIRTDIESGVLIPWARLVQSEYIKGL